MTNLKDRPLILLLGGAGSGKSAIALELEKRYGLHQTPSYTTRAPRFDGEPGHTFIDYQMFFEMMLDHMLVAYTEVEGFHYGATQPMVDDADIYVIDPFGAKILAERYKTKRPVYYIYLEVTAEERAKRVTERGTAQDVQNRKEHDASIAALAKEVSDLYQHVLIIENFNLESTIHEIANLVGLENAKEN